MTTIRSGHGKEAWRLHAALLFATLACLASPIHAAADERVEALSCGERQLIIVDTNANARPDPADTTVTAEVFPLRLAPLTGPATVIVHRGAGPSLRGLTDSRYSFTGSWAEDASRFELSMLEATGVSPPVKKRNFVRIEGRRHEQSGTIDEITISRSAQSMTAILCQEREPAVLLPVSSFANVLIGLEPVTCGRDQCEQSAAGRATHLRLPSIPLLPNGCSGRQAFLRSECRPHLVDAYWPLCDGAIDITLANDSATPLMRIKLEDLSRCADRAPRWLSTWIVIWLTVIFIARLAWWAGATAAE